MGQRTVRSLVSRDGVGAAAGPDSTAAKRRLAPEAKWAIFNLRDLFYFATWL